MNIHSASIISKMPRNMLTFLSCSIDNRRITHAPLTKEGLPKF